MIFRKLPVRIHHVAIIFTLALAPSLAHAATFTEVFTDPSPSDSFLTPAISSSGEATVIVVDSTNAYNVIAGNGGALTTFYSSSSDYPTGPMINASGTVAFPINSNTVVTGTSSSNLTTIPGSGYTASVINDSNLLALRIGGYALETYDGSNFNTLASTNTPIGPAGYHGQVANDINLNNAGAAVLTGWSTNDSVIDNYLATATPSAVTVLADTANSPRYGSFAEPSITSGGTVVAKALLATNDSEMDILSITGGTTTVLATTDDSQPGRMFNTIYDIAASNAGTLIQGDLNDGNQAGVTNGTDGIFLLKDGVLSTVIEYGDPLDGKIADYFTISANSFNDAGQVAFIAYFDDNSTGLYIASDTGQVTAVPEPASLAVLLVAAPIFFLRRRLSPKLL